MPASQDNAMSWILERMTEIDQGKIEEGGDSRYKIEIFIVLDFIFLTKSHPTLPHLKLLHSRVTEQEEIEEAASAENLRAQQQQQQQVM